MNGDVTVKDKTGIIVRIPYTLLKNAKPNGKSEEATKESTKDVTKQ